MARETKPSESADSSLTASSKGFIAKKNRNNVMWWRNEEAGAEQGRQAGRETAE